MVVEGRLGGEGWACPVEIPVQWGDQDAFGHVNNIVYLRWFETGRIAFFSSLGMPHDARGVGLGPILASVTCNFRRQLHFPETVRVETRVTRIGGTSFNVEHRIVGVRSTATVADGTSVVVYFDYQAGRPTRVPDSLRRAVTELGGLESSSARPTTPDSSADHV